MASLPVKQKPDASNQETVEKQFRRLAEVWRRDTDFLSSMEEANKHPAHQQIIDLGSAVVPFLLRDMEDNHTHWFAALRAITGAQPIPMAAAGNIPKMVEHWLGWAKDNGYQH